MVCLCTYLHRGRASGASIGGTGLYAWSSRVCARALFCSPLSRGISAFCAPSRPPRYLALTAFAWDTSSLSFSVLSFLRLLLSTFSPPPILISSIYARVFRPLARSRPSNKSRSRALNHRRRYTRSQEGKKESQESETIAIIIRYAPPYYANS